MKIKILIPSFINQQKMAKQKFLKITLLVFIIFFFGSLFFFPLTTIAQQSFGKTTVGAFEWTSGSDKNMAKFDLSTSGRVTDLRFYGHRDSAGSTAVKGFIYADNNGVPGALKGTSDQTLVSGTTSQWFTLTFSSPVSLLSGTYWLGLLQETATIHFYNDAGGVSAYDWEPYGNPSNPCASPDGYETRDVSIYALLAEDYDFSDEFDSLDTIRKLWTGDENYNRIEAWSNPPNKPDKWDGWYQNWWQPCLCPAGQPCTPINPCDPNYAKCPRLPFNPSNPDNGQCPETYGTNPGSARIVSSTVNGPLGTPTNVLDLYREPTLGKTTVGGTEWISGSNKNMAKFNLSTAGEVSNLRFYGHRDSAGSTAVKGFIYADNNNAPGTLRGTTGETTITATASQWFTLVFSSPVSLPAGTYWLGLLQETPTIHFYNDAGGVSAYDTEAYGNPSDPSASPDGYETKNVSIYASFCNARAHRFLRVKSTTNYTVSTQNFLFTVTFRLLNPQGWGVGWGIDGVMKAWNTNINETTNITFEGVPGTYTYSGNNTKWHTVQFYSSNNGTYRNAVDTVYDGQGGSSIIPVGFATNAPVLPPNFNGSIWFGNNSSQVEGVDGDCAPVNDGMGPWPRLQIDSIGLNFGSTNGDVNPNSGCGGPMTPEPETFSTTHFYNQGADKITQVAFLLDEDIDPYNDTIPVFFGMYDRDADLFRCRNATTGNWIDAGQPGSQMDKDCGNATLITATKTITGQDKLTADWTIRFKSGFARTVNIFTWSMTQYVATGWEQKGTYNIDGVAPTTPGVPPPPGNSPSPPDGATVTIPNPVLSATSTDDGCGSSQITYQFRLDNDTDHSAVFRTRNWGDNSWETNPNLSPGTYYWQAQAKDARENISDWSPWWKFEFTMAPVNGPVSPLPYCIGANVETEFITEHTYELGAVNIQEVQFALVEGTTIDSPKLFLGKYLPPTNQFYLDDNGWKPLVAGGVEIPNKVRLESTSNATGRQGGSKTLKIHWHITFLDNYEKNVTTWVRSWGGLDTGWEWKNEPGLYQIDTKAPDKPSFPNPPDDSFVTTPNPILSAFSLNGSGCGNTEVQYQFILDDNMTSPWMKEKDWSISPSWQTNFSLPLNTSYYWRVQARDAAGNLSGWSEGQNFPWSPWWKFTIHKPLAQNLRETQQDPCQFGATYLLSWDFVDPYHPGQSAYQIQIDKNSNFNSQELIDANGTTSTAYMASGLKYDTKYYWRVKVWDSIGLESDWATTDFKTLKQAYPDVKFTWSPSTPTVKEKVSFFDSSTTKGNPNDVSWSWTFPDGNPNGSVQKNPIVKFTKIGRKDVSLTVTDSFGNSCTATTTIVVRLPLPDWKEVSPSAWIRKLMATISGIIKIY